MNDIISNFTNSDFYGYMNIGILLFILIACVFFGIYLAIRPRHEREADKAKRLFSNLIKTDDKS